MKRNSGIGASAERANHGRITGTGLPCSAWRPRRIPEKYQSRRNAGAEQGHDHLNYGLTTLRNDIFGGITTTAVLLPAALAYGVLSGIGPAAGLYGAVAAGFFAGLFGGTRAQITGPSAALAVVTAVIVANYAASLTEALMIVVMGGFLQVLLGLSRIGRYVAYTPYMVIAGFNSGIGIIVILIQMLPFLGSPIAPGGPLGALRAVPEALSDINVSAVAIAATTLAIGVLWPRRLAQFVPAPVVGLVAGTLLGVLWLRGAPVIGPMPAGLGELQLPAPSAAMLVNAVQPAIILALFASMRTLLTSLIADSFTGERHDPDRELVSQGIGNMAAGLIGGMPAAGATQFTVTNVLAGGRSRVSSILPSLLILAMLLGLSPLVEPIPLAALAGTLMRIGWSMIDWRVLTRARLIPRGHLVVMLMTLGMTVFVDLITAISIGLIAAAFVRARQLEHLELDSVVSVPVLDRTFFSGYEGLATADPMSARVGLVLLRGRFTVASSRKLVAVIGADIRDHEVVIFDFSHTTFLSHSAAMVIEQLLETAANTQTEIVATGLRGPAADSLRALGVLRLIPGERVVGTMDDARRVAAGLLQG